MFRWKKRFEEPVDIPSIPEWVGTVCRWVWGLLLLSAATRLVWYSAKFFWNEWTK